MGYPAMTRQAGALEHLLRTPAPDWQQVAEALAGLDEQMAQALAAMAAAP